jgi:ATP-dependent Clp protease ATP-binding subunit ClpA
MSDEEKYLSTDERALRLLEKTRPEFEKYGSILETYGQNLNALAKTGKLPVDPRFDPEAAYYIRVLSRRRKRFPLLISDSNTCKRTVLNQVAHAIVNGKVSGNPRVELDKEIYVVDFAALRADSLSDEDYQLRWYALLKEIADSGERKILVFDISILDGFRQAEMTDFQRLLFTLLNGVIQVIGLSRREDYGRIITSDARLDRIFAGNYYADLNCEMGAAPDGLCI